MESSFEELLENSPSGYKDGLLRGVVVKKIKDGVYLDLKTKADKFIPRGDFLQEEWDNLNVGDELDVVIYDGRASYSKARIIAALDEIKNSFQNKEPIQIKILKSIKGGFSATFKGVSVFVPLSQTGKKEKIAEGNVYNAMIIKFEEKDKNVVCSISEIEKAEKEMGFAKFIEENSIGKTISGKVKAIIEKGVFVDLGGFEGFIPFSEITYKRIKTPKDVFSINDLVNAQIIDIVGKNKKITLSTKALEEKPWNKFLKTFKVGDKTEGIVRNIINSGVFVEIIDGVDGFVHVSEISWTERVNDPKKYFNVGDKISCIIKSIDEKNHKVSLSFKEVLSNPWQEFLDNNLKGSVLACKVKEINEKGLVVYFDNNIEGFIPNDNISWSKVNDVKKEFKVGDEISAKFIEGDERRRKLLFSIKDLSPDPWLLAKEKIHVNAEVEGTVSGISDKVVFFEVMPHVEGIVKKSEFERNRNSIDLKLGDKLTLLVKEFDPKHRKLHLTYKGLEQKREREAMAEFKNQNTTKVTLGDFLKR